MHLMFPRYNVVRFTPAEIPGLHSRDYDAANHATVVFVKEGRVVSKQ